MQVARVEAVRDPPAGLFERRGSALDRPVAGKRPLIEPQLRRGGVDVTLVQHGAAGRREVLGALVADVGLRVTSGCPSRRRFGARGLDRHELVIDVAAPASASSC